MKFSEKVKLALSNPREIGRSIMVHTAKYWKNDEVYLKLLYYFRMGRRLNLKNPTTFNEKLQWIKLHDRDPRYTMMVDKFEVKDYVASLIGSEYIIPTLAVWDKIEDINLSTLPDKFVLKTTNGGGGCGVVICADKKSLDLEAAKRKLAHSLSSNIYINSREWPYKNVVPRVIAEQFMIDDTTGDLRDYKYYCFDGEPKMLLIATERFTSAHAYFDYFDMHKNHLKFTQGGENNPITPDLPEQFDEMKELAAKLSKGIRHVRVDFYVANGHVYFGELTFFDSCGFAAFNPKEWDTTIGNWIKI